MTVNEVADLLRTSPETVRYWRHIGKGPKSFKVGRRVLYAAADVEAFVDELLPPRMEQVEPWGGPVYEVRRSEAATRALEGTVHPLAEQIAQALETDAQHEGPRAQRVMKMCAYLARDLGRKYAAD